MAGASGREGSSLAADLAAAPAGYAFFQAVRLLERLYPNRAPVGHFGEPGAEVAHFSAYPSVAFPASEIESLALEDNDPVRVSVNFMGLIGPIGVLPYHYTQLVMERLRARDRAMLDFLDIFQHRIISLFYRAWSKHHFLGSYESGQSDPVTSHVRDVLGFGIPATRPQPPLRVDGLLFYASALAPQQRSAVALQQMLEDFFEVPAVVEQFVGGWYRLGPGVQCVLGDEDNAASQLGRGSVVGDEIWDQQAKVRIRLGPLVRSEYDRFLPSGDAYQVLRKLVSFYSHDQLDFEVQLVLAPEHVSRCHIGADVGPPPALGWGTWLRTGTFDREADETVLTL